MQRPHLLFVISAILSAAIASTGNAQPAEIPPRTVTLDASANPIPLADLLPLLTEQTNIPVRLDGNPDAEFRGRFDQEPFWSALQTVAERTGHRIALRDRGDAITLEPAEHAPPSAVSGPFRLVLREGVTRRDFVTGKVTHHLGMLVHWEPRLVVLRIDAYPELEGVTADGQPYRLPPVEVSKPVAGSQSESLARLDGYDGRFEDLTVRTAAFRATVAEQMLEFRFDDLTGLPAAKERGGVRATVGQVQTRGGRTIVSVELTYPPDLPTFESFENWLADNRIALVSPDGKRELTTNDYRLRERGRTILADYVFRDADLGDRKGWSLRYEAPSPPREVTVRFTLE